MLSRDQMKGLPPIPQGEHKFTVLRAQKRPSSSGNPSVEIILAVPEDTDTLGPEFVARDTKVTLSLQEQAAFTFGNFVAAINGYGTVDEYFDGEEIEDFDASAWDPEPVVGMQIIGVVSHQLYQGRTTHQIRVFKPVPVPA